MTDLQPGQIPLKPGYQTTEFWTKVIFTLLTFANESGYLGQPLPIPAIMAIAAPVVVYILARSAQKALAAYLGANVKPATAGNA